MTQVLSLDLINSASACVEENPAYKSAPSIEKPNL
jgi:hypothetical protein